MARGVRSKLRERRPARRRTPNIDFNKVPRYVREEVDPPAKTVAKGIKGETVRRIQEWLNYHQFRTAMNADFGPATETCVQEFQESRKMKASGKVDTATWAELVGPMRDALDEPKRLNRMNATEAVLAVARQHLQQHPVEIGGSNKGPWVRLYCYGNDGPAWAWCAGFVTLVMQQAYFYRGAAFPIDGSVSCDTLAAQGKAAGLFVDGRDISSGRVPWEGMGDVCVFLRRRTPTDWTHTGFAFDGVGAPKELVFTTIEGNTNDEGSREGFEACMGKRSVVGDNYDFIRFPQ